MDAKPRPARWTPLWVATTYFAEGLPLWTVRNLVSVYLTDIGAREAYLGFLNFLNLPWNLKFLWSPAVDLWGTKRGWLLKVELLVTLLIGAIGVLTAFGPAPVPTGVELDVAGPGMESVNAILALLVALAFLAATHDVCIDGYYLEAIRDPGEQAVYTGLRVLTHRLARFFANGLLVAVAGWFTWAHGFLGAAAAMALLLGFHWAYLPFCETAKAARGFRQNLIDFGRAFLTYLDQPGIVLGLLFVITYKLGDEVLFSMHTPFLMRELGISKEDDLPWINGVVSPLSSIAGSMVSAWAIKRWGLRKAIWPLTLGMNLNIWAYVGLAWMAEQTWVAGTAPLPDVWEVAFVCGYEQFAAGLGAAVLVVYIMRTCKAEFKAAHYAVASAIASLGGTLVGGFGGIVVEETGYVILYLIAFAAALPSMVILGFLKLEEP